MYKLLLLLLLHVPVQIIRYFIIRGNRGMTHNHKIDMFVVYNKIQQVMCLRWTYKYTKTSIQNYWWNTFNCHQNFLKIWHSFNFDGLTVMINYNSILYAIQKNKFNMFGIAINNHYPKYKQSTVLGGSKVLQSISLYNT